MIDYLYYFIYQHVRKGYKKDTSSWVKTFILFFFVPLFVTFISLHVTLIVNKFFAVPYYGVIFTLMAVVIVFLNFFLEKRYGQNGTNLEKIKLLIKKNKKRSRSRIMDGITIFLFCIIFIVINLKIFWVLKKYLGN